MEEENRLAVRKRVKEELKQTAASSSSSSSSTAAAAAAAPVRSTASTTVSIPTTTAATAPMTADDYKRAYGVHMLQLQRYRTTNDEFKATNLALEKVITGIRELLQDPISGEDMTAPVVFDCQHAVQYVHLLDWHRICMGGGKQFTCPVCRTPSTRAPADMHMSLLAVQLRGVLYPNETLDWSKIQRPTGSKSNLLGMAKTAPAAAALPFSRADVVCTTEDIKRVVDQRRQLYREKVELAGVWASSFMHKHVSKRLFACVAESKTFAAEEWFDLKVELPHTLDDFKLAAIKETIETATHTPGVVATLSVPPSGAAATAAATSAVPFAPTVLTLRIPVRLK